MCKLTFPTQAERAIQAFGERRYPSLARACRAMGGTREDGPGFPPSVDWAFEDDTVVRVRGRGRGHQFEALLP